MAPSHRLTTLDSGQRVVTERLDHVRSVSLGVWVGAGSRDERPPVAGVSHFLEHLLFKGAGEYSTQQISQIFDELGGELNAATSKEYTVFYCRVLDEHLGRAFDVVQSMIQAPRWEDLDQERDVVIEEIAMYEDQPSDFVHDLLAERVYGPHPLGRPVIGTREIIGTVPADDISGYHRRMYEPANLVVAAAGNVDHDEIVRLTTAAFGGRDAGRANLRVAEPLAAPAPTMLFQAKPTEQFHVCLGAPGLPRGDDRRFVLSALDTLLGGGMSSRLFEQVREQRGLAYSVYSFASGSLETGEVGVYVGTRPANVEQAVSVIVDELRKVGAGDVGAEELRRAKEHLKGRLVLGLESSGSRMNRIGKGVLLGSELLELDEMIARVEAVTRDQVTDLAAELFDPDRMSVVGVGPEADAFARAGAAVNGTLAGADVDLYAAA